LTKVIDIKEVFTEEDIEKAFKYFDTTDSGAISTADISSYMRRKGEK
jgi:Ca2+-binding EF-hand superfamily protein